MSTRQALALVVLVVSLAGCGDDSSSQGPDADVGPPVAIDAGAECSAEARVDEVPDPGPGGNTQAFRQEVPDGGGATQVVWSWVVPGRGGSPDYLTFTLDEPAPIGQVLQLEAACTGGAPHCWLLETDVTIDNEGYHPTQTFYPDEGTVTLHEVGPTGSGKLRATFTGAKFFHYVEGPTGWSPARDHDTCTTTIKSPLELEIDIGGACNVDEASPHAVSAGHTRNRRFPSDIA